jgi:CHAT domain-containing protein
MAVVSGDYRPPLEEASQEAADLIGAFSAQRVEAKMDPLIGFLQEIGGSDVLHFAIHGSYDGGSGEGGLVLADGEVLEPTSVRGLEFASKPFVFLNVCQLGAGEALLGDYAGMSGAFVHAGASGVVAPLWSIGDSSAREIAKSFYDGSRSVGGVSPAEYLRAQRASAGGADLRTHIAYQFHGHPSMRVST